MRCPGPGPGHGDRRGLEREGETGEDEGFVPMDAPPPACRSMESSLHGLGFRVHGSATTAAWLWRTTTSSRGESRVG